MLTIRLQRAGKKNRPEYRVVLAQTTASASKKFVEILGSYNPHTKALGIRKPERLNYWINQHVSMSPTVHNLLIANKLMEGSKVRAFNVPKKEVVAEEAPKADAPAPEGTETTDEGQTETPSEVTAPEENAPAEAPTPAQEPPAEEPAA